LEENRNLTVKQKQEEKVLLRESRILIKSLGISSLFSIFGYSIWKLWNKLSVGKPVTLQKRKKLDPQKPDKHNIKLDQQEQDFDNRELDPEEPNFHNIKLDPPPPPFVMDFSSMDGLMSPFIKTETRSLRSEIPQQKSDVSIRELIEKIKARDYDGVETLIKAGVEMNMVLEGDTHDALEWAIMQKNESLIDLLLRHGVDINRRNDDGNTPLTFITGSELSTSEELGIVAFLLNRGADPNRAVLYCNSGNAPYSREKK
jgi:Ankyrin repeats (many copies)